jgi:hypothetical protein
MRLFSLAAVAASVALLGSDAKAQFYGRSVPVAPVVVAPGGFGVGGFGVGGIGVGGIGGFGYASPGFGVYYGRSAFYPAPVYRPAYAPWGYNPGVYRPGCGPHHHHSRGW